MLIPYIQAGLKRNNDAHTKFHRLHVMVGMIHDMVSIAFLDVSAHNWFFKRTYTEYIKRTK